MFTLSMASGSNLKQAPAWWHGGDLDHLAALCHNASHPSSGFLVPNDLSEQTKKTFQALKKHRATFQQVKDGKGKFKFIDLFAGIGGFRLAGNNVGGECVFTSEWDSYARTAYAHSFGQVPFGDIHEFSKPSIAKDFVPDHHVLCGGFPCQAFSISGKQAGFDDERGSLFFEICKIAKAKQPEVLFLENVRNFSRHGNPEGATFKEVKRRLEVVMACKETGGRYYRVSSAVLNSSHFGAATKRERIYIVAVRDDLIKSEDQWNKWESMLNGLDTTNGAKTIPLRRVLQKNADIAPEILSRITIKRRWKRNDEIIVPKNCARPVRIGVISKGGQGERVYSIDGHAITFSAYGGGVASKTGAYEIEDIIRKLTPKECADAMGFTGMDVNGNGIPLLQQYKQFGNSVVVNVVEHIFSQIQSTWLTKSR
jgi:DNA (cytosine-5)-methyltransferase 1